jgi:hypothetical protein
VIISDALTGVAAPVTPLGERGDERSDERGVERGPAIMAPMIVPSGSCA